MKQPTIAQGALMGFAATFLGSMIAVPTVATADEGGVSFWLPGFFGSLAAAPQQPGWSLTSIYYHTSVSAGADVARAREFETGRIPVNLTANVSASLNAKADLGLVMPTYTFATPVFWRPAYGWCHWNVRRHQHLLGWVSDRYFGDAARHIPILAL